MTFMCMHIVKTGPWHDWTCLYCGHHEVIRLHGKLAEQSLACTAYDERNPFGHEFDVHDGRCSTECRACVWSKENTEFLRRRAVFEMKERLGYPTELVTPTTEENDWLLSYHISWEGDTRC